MKHMLPLEWTSAQSSKFILREPSQLAPGEPGQHGARVLRVGCKDRKMPPAIQGRPQLHLDVAQEPASMRLRDSLLVFRVPRTTLTNWARLRPASEFLETAIYTRLVSEQTCKNQPLPSRRRTIDWRHFQRRGICRRSAAHIVYHPRIPLFPSRNPEVDSLHRRRGSSFPRSNPNRVLRAHIESSVSREPRTLQASPPYLLP